MDQKQLPDGINAEQDKPVYVLRLFITGASPYSVRAVTNTKKMCEQYLNGHYELEIVDIYQQPLFAEREQIIAIPLLIRKFPLPERRLIGDMSDTQKLLKGLEITVR